MQESVRAIAEERYFGGLRWAPSALESSDGFLVLGAAARLMHSTAHAETPLSM